MNHLHNRIEPFPVLFLALGIVLAHIQQKVTQPADLASLNFGTGTVLYGRGQLYVQFDEVFPPILFLSAVIILW